MADKLAVLGWAGPLSRDGLALLLQPTTTTTPSNASALKPVLSWLLPRVAEAEGMMRPSEAKDGDADMIERLSAFLAQHGITGLDPELLHRGHGLVRFVYVRFAFARLLPGCPREGRRQFGHPITNADPLPGA